MPTLRPSPRRTGVERRSAVVLAWLSLQPRLLLPGVVLGLLLLSAFLPRVPGALCLVPVVLLSGWLSYLSWPTLDRRGRVLRAVVLVLLVVLVAVLLS